MFRYAWSLDKLYLLLRIPIVIVSSLKPFILIIYPARIIDCIMNQAEPGVINRYIVEMALLQLLAADKPLQFF